jgi:hypothetical protein
LFLHRIRIILVTISILGFAWAASSRADSVALRWTAPGEDSLVGRAALYDLRYSAQMITPQTFLQAIQAPGMPLPAMAGTRQSYVLEGLPSGVICYIAIKTRNQAGNWSAMSNVIAHMPQSVVQAPAASALMSPEDGATGVAIEPTLTWQASNGATSYRLQVARAVDFSSPLVDQSGIVGTSRAVAGLANDSTYHWGVQASSASGLSEWSSMRSFRTVAGPLPGISFSAPWPNPARDVARFAWILPAAAELSVQVFDLSGRRVRVLLEGSHEAGRGGLTWDLRDDRGVPLPGGIYLVRARLGEVGFFRRVVIAR